MTEDRAGLYRQRLTQLLRDRVLLDQAIAGMERLVAAAASPLPVSHPEPPPARPRQVTPPAPLREVPREPGWQPPRRARLSEEKEARRAAVRALYEQDDPILTLAEVARQGNTTATTLCKWAKEDGWERPPERIRQTGKRSIHARARRNGVVPATTVAVDEDDDEERDDEGLPIIEVAPPVDRLPGVKRRCQACERITMADPCSHCGAPLFLKGRL